MKLQVTKSLVIALGTPEVVFWPKNCLDTEDYLRKQYIGFSGVCMLGLHGSRVPLQKGSCGG